MPRVLSLQAFEKRTVPDLLDRARVFGEDRPFLIDLGSNQTLDYATVLRRVSGAATRLAKRFPPGRRIAVIGGNTDAYLILRYALSCAGLVEVAVNSAHRGMVLKTMLALAEAHAIVVEDAFVETLRACGHDTTGIELIGEAALAEITSSDAPWEERPRPDIAPHDAARILFTSGTGGRSRAVELSHAYEVYTGERHNGLLGITPQDRWLYVTPLYHIDAIYIASILLHTGGAFALAPNFSVFRFWRDVERAQATYLCYLGSLLALLMKSDGPSSPTTLKVALGGGASAALIEVFEARFGVTILEAFAMTECIACTLNRIDDRTIGSVGKPIDGYEVRVVDDEGEERPSGRAGEIVVRTHEPCGLFTRYFGDEKATAKAMRGGWFHTGDLGTFDGDGNLYYRGRMNDAIRRRGENIPTLELEQIVEQHPDVTGAAALGVPSDLEEQEILLYVEPRSCSTLGVRDIHAFLTKRVARFMMPAHIRLIDHLPRSDTQKVLKSELPALPDDQTWTGRTPRTE